jgi:hypothetical protein
MAKFDAQVSVMVSKEFEELFELLGEYHDQIPERIKEATKALANDETLCWDSDWLAEHGYDGMNANIFADGAKLEHVKCLYPFRKAVAFYDENMILREIKAEHAQIQLDDGYIIREW